VFTVNQASPPCYYTLSPGTAIWGAAGGSGSFAVTASSPSCAWTATSSNSSQVSVTSGASGTGNGTVSYSVAANKSGALSPAITVADANGGSSAFSITQASDYSCTFPLSPASVGVSAEGTSNFFAVNASNSFCNWTATSNNPGALSVTVNPSGQGVGTVYYAVAQNTSSQPRTLTITAGCETFTVNQDGAGVTNNPVPAITGLMPGSVTAGTGQFTLTVNGSNFVSGATVSFNGTAESSTFVSSSQLTAAIPASAVATVGNVPVIVTNPAPGGGPSNALNFIISSTSSPGAAVTGIAFGNQTEGIASAAMAATLTNTSSSASLSITGITITGTNAGDFVVTTGSGACGTSLAAGKNCFIYVVFTPSTAAAESATLSVADNAAGSPQTAALTGTGVVPPASAVTLSLTSLSFGNQEVNTTSSVQSVTVTNSGASTLNISSIYLNEPSQNADFVRSRPLSLADGTKGTPDQLPIQSSPDYAATTTCGSTLAAGANCTISVTFDPSIAGSLPGTLGLSDNASNSPQTVALSGAGVTAGSFSVASPTPAQTINAGGSAQYTISVAVTPSGDIFPNQVTLSVTGLPTGATASFSPAQVVPGSGTVSSTMSVQTSPQASLLAPFSQGGRWPVIPSTLALACCGALAGFRRKHRDRFARCLALLLLLVSLGAATFGLMGCGAGFAQSQPKTYTITVTGTSGASTASTTVQLTVE
jgi:trimeric autotransporter adhesin